MHLHKLPDARKLHNFYNLAKPLPHCLLFDIFDDRLLRRISWEVDNYVKRRQKQKYQSEFLFNNFDEFQYYSKEFISELQSSDFCKWLERLTGHRNLIPDPTLKKSGLQALLKSRKLKIYDNPNYSKKFKLIRTISVVISLNDDWKIEWGGITKLRKPNASETELNMSPQLGNVAICDTPDICCTSLKCPPDIYRKNLILHYYKTPNGS